MSSAEPATVQAVVEQIEIQLDYFAERLAPTLVETVYVGGGTPSILGPPTLDRLLARIGRFVREVAGDPLPEGDRPGGVCSEWTVEANPESLGPEHLEICAGRGVGRLSVGIQSFDAGILSTLGRPSGAVESRSVLELLAAHWSGQTNLDLISGVPGQDWQGLRRDLQRALEAQPDHVSLYSLTLDEPDHPLAEGLDPEQQDHLWLLGQRLLEKRGYRNYEISNFARPGRESRHNLRYWRLEPFLGVGPAAASTLPGAGDAVLRLANPQSLAGYLQGKPESWGLQVESIAPREFLLETLMMGLRLREGLDAARFVERFGAALPELVPGLWQRWAGQGLLAGGAASAGSPIGADGVRATGPARYALSFEGRMILDRLLVELHDELAGVPAERLHIRWGG